MKNGVSDGKINYTYDKMGNISSISENGIQKIKYEYDLIGRLIKEIAIDKQKAIYCICNMNFEKTFYIKVVLTTCYNK